MKSSNTLTKKLSGGLLAALLGLSSVSAAHAQIFVANDINYTIGEYTTSGATVNASLVRDTGNPFGIVVSGSDLFVSNQGAGTIGEYTTSGATVNASLVTGLSAPWGIAISGNDLFVVNLARGTIGEYTTSGATVNASLVTGLNEPSTIAVSGSDLFVMHPAGGGGAVISEYTTSGATVNASLIALTGIGGIAVSGSDLFVTNDGSGTIGEYTTSGATVNASLVTGLKSPYGIAVLGADIFVTNLNKTSEYTTSGATVNASLISDEPEGIAVENNSETWSGSSGGNWGTGSNWSSGVSPGFTTGTYNSDTATFNSSTGVTVTIDSTNQVIGTLSFSGNTTGAFVIGGSGANGGNSLLLSSGGSITNSITDSTATAETINAPLVLEPVNSSTAGTYAFTNNASGGDLLNIAGNVSGGTTSSTITLTLSGTNTGYNTISGIISNGNATGGLGITKSGAGTWVLTGSNTYSGSTTISAGTIYVNNTSGSGTGLGSVTVNSGGTLAGSGRIAPTSGTGVTINSGGSLYSGGVASGTPATGPGTGMTLNNTAGLSSILSVSGDAPANLTFALGSGNSGIVSSPASGFSNPNDNTTYMTVVAGNSNPIIDFSGPVSVTLVDLTNGVLSLRQGTPYLLIQAYSTALGVNQLGDDALYSGLVTSATDNINNLALDGNGYVMGVGTLSSYTPISIIELASDGVTPLTGGNLYPNAQLYLYNGNLEVVPEPSTWAMLLGGLGLLAFWHLRTRRKHV